MKSHITIQNIPHIQPKVGFIGSDYHCKFYFLIDQSLSSPPASDSASFTSSDHPILSARKILGDTSLPQSAGDYTNAQSTDHRISSRKPSYSDMNPQTRILSLVNHLQYRRTSGVMRSYVLPAVVGRRNEDSLRALDRSKTLDVVFALSNETTKKIPSRLPARADSPQSLSNILSRSINGNDPIPSRLPQRSILPPPHTLRSEQQPTTQPLVQLVQYQNIQNSAQRYHYSAHSSTTTAPANKVLVHLKYSNGGNTDRDCLIPD